MLAHKEHQAVEAGFAFDFGFHGVSFFFLNLPFTTSQPGISGSLL